MTHPTPADEDSPFGTAVPRLVIALSLVVAGSTHLVVASEHASTSASAAAFFVIAGVTQLAVAAAMSRTWGPGVLGPLALAHVGLVTVHLLSRTLDLPFLRVSSGGHDVTHLSPPRHAGGGIAAHVPNAAEPVGSADLLCIAAELLALAALTGLLPGRWRRTVSAAGVLAIVLVSLARARGSA